MFGPELNVMAFDYDLRFGSSRAIAHNLSVGTTDDLMLTVSDRRNGAPRSKPRSNRWARSKAGSNRWRRLMRAECAG
ncbi:MAG: Dimodular nonribosomal peptide synthase [Burkholderia plantarii]|nr:MAG: Dimodular nonribosomal peptide synthase [Burkholderia plantarii]